MSVSESFRSAGSPRRTAIALALFSLAPFLGGCDWLRGSTEPEIVHIEVGGDAGSVTLVRSMFFVQLVDEECPQCEPIIQLINADTSQVTPPFEQSYNFTTRLQVFFEMFPTEEVSATLDWRVLIDDARWADESRTLQPFDEEGNREAMRFVYQYRDISF